jgi:VIT1/CCC1 family predicted Fe2+/Mn2+ transporter
MEYVLYLSTLMFLVLLGTVSAKTGGSSVIKAVVRVTIWGTVAMGITAFVGYLFGVIV